MKKFYFILILGGLMGMMLGLFSFVPVLAQTVGDIQLENPLGTTEITDILGNVVKKILTILGSISLVVFVAGGFLWLTSAGNAEKIKTGTNTMLYAIIGLFIIFSSYAILNMLIGGVTGGSVGGSEEEGGSETIDDTQDKLCKDYKPEWSCLPIEKCDGVKVKGTEYMEACAAAYQTCINNKCPGDNTPNIKCCKPKAEVVDRASGSGQSVGDACGGTAHPTWSCTNILNCNINLVKKESVTEQRAVCKKTPDKCVTGKCAGDNNIVCCESECNGGKGCSENQFCFMNKCLSRCEIKVDRSGFDTYCNTADALRLSWCALGVPPLKFDQSKTEEVEIFCASKKSKEECSDSSGEKKANVFCSWLTDKDVYKKLYIN